MQRNNSSNSNQNSTHSATNRKAMLDQWKQQKQRSSINANGARSDKASASLERQPFANRQALSVNPTKDHAINLVNRVNSQYQFNSKRAQMNQTNFSAGKNQIGGQASGQNSRPASKPATPVTKAPSGQELAKSRLFNEVEMMFKEFMKSKDADNMEIPYQKRMLIDPEKWKKKFRSYFEGNRVIDFTNGVSNAPIDNKHIHYKIKALKPHSLELLNSSCKFWVLFGNLIEKKINNNQDAKESFIEQLNTRFEHSQEELTFISQHLKFFEMPIQSNQQEPSEQTELVFVDLNEVQQEQQTEQKELPQVQEKIEPVNPQVQSLNTQQDYTDQQEQSNKEAESEPQQESEQLQTQVQDEKNECEQQLTAQLEQSHLTEIQEESAINNSGQFNKTSTINKSPDFAIIDSEFKQPQNPSISKAQMMIQKHQINQLQQQEDVTFQMPLKTAVNHYSMDAHMQSEESSSMPALMQNSTVIIEEPQYEHEVTKDNLVDQITDEIQSQIQSKLEQQTVQIQEDQHMKSPEKSDSQSQKDVEVNEPVANLTETLEDIQQFQTPELMQDQQQDEADDVNQTFGDQQQVNNQSSQQLEAASQQSKQNSQAQQPVDQEQEKEAKEQKDDISNANVTFYTAYQDQNHRINQSPQPENQQKCVQQNLGDPVQAQREQEYQEMIQTPQKSQWLQQNQIIQQEVPNVTEVFKSCQTIKSAALDQQEIACSNGEQTIDINPCEQQIYIEKDETNTVNFTEDSRQMTVKDDSQDIDQTENTINQDENEHTLDQQKHSTEKAKVSRKRRRPFNTDMTDQAKIGIQTRSQRRKKVKLNTEVQIEKDSKQSELKKQQQSVVIPAGASHVKYEVIKKKDQEMLVPVRYSIRTSEQQTTEEQKELLNSKNKQLLYMPNQLESLFSMEQGTQELACMLKSRDAPQLQVEDIQSIEQTFKNSFALITLKQDSRRKFNNVEQVAVMLVEGPTTRQTNTQQKQANQIKDLFKKVKSDKMLMITEPSTAAMTHILKCYQNIIGNL